MYGRRKSGLKPYLWKLIYLNSGLILQNMY
jgi:hypothetical protein